MSFLDRKDALVEVKLPWLGLQPAETYEQLIDSLTVLDRAVDTIRGLRLSPAAFRTKRLPLLLAIFRRRRRALLHIVSIPGRFLVRVRLRPLAEITANRLEGRFVSANKFQHFVVHHLVTFL